MFSLDSFFFINVRYSRCKIVSICDKLAHPSHSFTYSRHTIHKDTCESLTSCDGALLFLRDLSRVPDVWELSNRENLPLPLVSWFNMGRIQGQGTYWWTTLKCIYEINTYIFIINYLEWLIKKVSVKIILSFFTTWHAYQWCNRLPADLIWHTFPF